MFSNFLLFLLNHREYDIFPTSHQARIDMKLFYRGEYCSSGKDVGLFCQWIKIEGSIPGEVFNNQ